MFQLLQNFAHKAEIRESKDEILVGEVVRAMARQGYATIQFLANDDFQRVRFKPLADPVLYSVFVTLNRMTGSGALSAALIGSKATLTFTAELKNRMSDPDDVLAMYKTDLANLFKMPMLGGIKLNHELSSVLATSSEMVDIDNYVLKGEAGIERMTRLLSSRIDKLREKLAPYKKPDR
jgi:hypothetical protein